ncbi:MAG: RND family efflux transporter MFP subunit [Myxococcota bacterium]
MACKSEPEAGAADAGPPPAKVVVAAVRAESLDDRWQTSAEVVALEAAELAAPVTGPVVAVHHRPGDPVTAGEVLLEIDRAPAAARQRRADAEADAAAAREVSAAARLARAERVGDTVMAAVELEELRAAQAAAAADTAALRAAADEAAVTLRRHRVRAPFGGHLTERLVDPGDWVSTGQQVLSVVNTTSVELNLAADARLATRLTVGAPAEVLTTSGRYDAHIIAVVPVIRADARTALVRLAIDGEHPLQPGQAVTVELPLTFSSGDGLLIPRDALLRDRSGDAVIRATSDDTAERLSIEVIASAESWLMVRSSLTVGDRIVVRGNERLRPGQPLLISEAPDETP